MPSFNELVGKNHCWYLRLVYSPCAVENWSKTGLSIRSCLLPLVENVPPCPLSSFNTARLLSLAVLPFHAVHLFCKNTSIFCLPVCKNHGIAAHWDSGWPYHDRLTVWLRRCERAEMQREALITVWPLRSPFIFNFTRVLWTLKGDSAPRLQLISDPFVWNKGLYWLCSFFLFLFF